MFINELIANKHTTEPAKHTRKPNTKLHYDHIHACTLCMRTHAYVRIHKKKSALILWTNSICTNNKCTLKCNLQNSLDI